MSFFPDGIEFSDIRSPLQILEEAREDWRTQTSGLLDLHISDGGLEEETTFLWEVYVIHTPTKRMAKLLSVAHRPDAAYPADIRPVSFDIPRYLKKSYTVQRRRSAPSLLSNTSYLRELREFGSEFITETVTNEWVCDTPAEFRKKLQTALTLGTVKSVINSLIAGSGRHEDDVSVEGSEDDSISLVDEQLEMPSHESGLE